jgi:F0F1-type ATP synthase assembly protein I
MDRKHDSGKDEARKGNPLVAYARYSEIGFIIPACVFLGFFIGKGFDHWLHTKWLFLVGLILGAIAGFIEMIRMATSASEDKQKNKQQ